MPAAERPFSGNSYFSWVEIAKERAKRSGRPDSSRALWNAVIFGLQVGAEAEGVSQTQEASVLDGSELARAISTHNDLDTALIAYELDLFPRSQVAATESAENLVEFFQPDALQRVLNNFAQ